MALNIPIPKELSHLKLDPRGYPIPFFVAYIDGKPDFRVLDQKKQFYCLEQRKCAICGKSLRKGEPVYFIGGPLTLKNKVCTDPAMHHVCAEFSMRACPHLYLQKAERRDTGLGATGFQNNLLSLDKPAELFIIKSLKYKGIKHPDQPSGKLIKFEPIGTENYKYENGKLKLYV